MSITKKAQEFVEKIKKDALSDKELSDLINLLQDLYEERDCTWHDKSKKHFFELYSEEDEIYDRL